ncbi:hypothetical protein ACFLU6_10890 [Acidobacteriota bacterium]
MRSTTFRSMAAKVSLIALLSALFLISYLPHDHSSENPGDHCFVCLVGFSLLAIVSLVAACVFSPEKKETSETPLKVFFYKRFFNPTEPRGPPARPPVY